VNRRELIFLPGAAMTAARALRAEQKPMPVIGLLGIASPGPYAPYVSAFREVLSEAGFVASLARPADNLTGVSILVVELSPKRLELLSEMVPKVWSDSPAREPEQSAD
jgi:hypothetical protein